MTSFLPGKGMDAMQKMIRQFLYGRSDRCVGIDIGTEHIKAAEVSLTGAKPELLRLGMLPLGDNVIRDEGITDSQNLAELLHKLLAANGIKAREAVVALGGRSFFSREVTLPDMPLEELYEAIRWDIDKYVPYEADNFYYDCSVVAASDNQQDMKVLLAAAPRNAVDSLVSLMKQAGLEPLAVDTEPLALYRTLEKADNCIVVDMGCEITQVSIFSQGSPAVTRTVPYGGRRFTEAIMHCLGLDYREAERLKQRQKGLLHAIEYPGEGSELHESLVDVVSELAHDVRRTAEYYQTQSRDTAVDRVIITGGGAKLDNLAPHMAEQLELPVIVQTTPQTLSFSPAIDKFHLDSLFPQYAIAIGLAMRGGDLR